MLTAEEVPPVTVRDPALDVSLVWKVSLEAVEVDPIHKSFVIPMPPEVVIAPVDADVALVDDVLLN